MPGRTKTYDIENILDTCMQYCLLTYINQLMSITNQVQRCERQRRYAQRMKSKATSWGWRQPGNRAVSESKPQRESERARARDRAPWNGEEVDGKLMAG